MIKKILYVIGGTTLAFLWMAMFYSLVSYLIS